MLALLFFDLVQRNNIGHAVEADLTASLELVWQQSRSLDSLNPMVE
jgi:hypothetical protein